jgi:phosphoglycolate phosphatase
MTEKTLLMFDLDGTLIDSREDIAAAVNRMRADCHLPPLPLKTVAGFVGDGIHVLVARALRGHHVDIEEATRICTAHYRAHLHDKTTLYPGVREGLEQLRAAGFRFAAISNKPSDFCREILRYFGIVTWFPVILGGGDTAELKPNPEPLLVAMSRARVTPDHAWMIGDHKTDLEAARRAGVRSVFLTSGIGEPGREKATRIFDSFAEMTAFFAA